MPPVPRGLVYVSDQARGIRRVRLPSTKKGKKTAPPQYTKLGGLIYIHGNGAKSDWTWGCVALENEQMKELFDAVSVGTPVTIKP